MLSHIKKSKDYMPNISKGNSMWKELAIHVDILRGKPVGFFFFFLKDWQMELRIIGHI